jgi:LDH2 family malate/lactate/ureidoglycolate dehydrogenase
MFIAINLATLAPTAESDAAADAILKFFLGDEAGGAEQVRYPGERVIQTRAENLAQGIPVDADLWRDVQSMLKA